MRLTNKEASEWLMAIKRDYIYGGDEDYDERRKIALDMGAEALENQKTGHWIPVSERLPKDFDTYLITLENRDVCQCDFNPDFWDEDNNRMGAFTYNHQYFDPATLGMIDEEEEAVNAIAWMPFEPYKAEREELKGENNE